MGLLKRYMAYDVHFFNQHTYGLDHFDLWTKSTKIIFQLQHIHYVNNQIR